MKRCSKCGRTKSHDQFNKNKRSKDGLGHWCRVCSAAASKASREKKVDDYRAKARIYAANNPREWTPTTRDEARERRLLRYFGLDVSAYNGMLILQDYRCAICRCDYYPSKPLSVDHRHSDGLIRGLLCSKCNSAIGYLLDDPNLFARVGSYLLDPPAARAFGPMYVPSKKAKSE